MRQWYSCKGATGAQPLPYGEKKENEREIERERDREREREREREMRKHEKEGMRKGRREGGREQKIITPDPLAPHPLSIPRFDRAPCVAGLLLRQ